MVELAKLEAPDRRRWRAWLEKNHDSSPGVWLVYYKGRTGVDCVDYEDSVREALCFGWIDSIIKRLDDDRFVRKFTPRKPASQWSDSNRRRWAELRAAGQLAPPGLAAAPTGNSYPPRPEIPELPGYFACALKANPKAWKHFRELAQSYRCRFVTWVHIAKRPETREARIRESIALLAAGKKLGMR